MRIYFCCCMFEHIEVAFDHGGIQSIYTLTGNEPMAHGVRIIATYRPKIVNTETPSLILYENQHGDKFCARKVNRQTDMATGHWLGDSFHETVMKLPAR
jgi:hypothetical protein